MVVSSDLQSCLHDLLVPSVYPLANVVPNSGLQCWLKIQITRGKIQNEPGCKSQKMRIEVWQTIPEIFALSDPISSKSQGQTSIAHRPAGEKEIFILFLMWWEWKCRKMSRVQTWPVLLTVFIHCRQFIRKFRQILSNIWLSHVSRSHESDGFGENIGTLDFWPTWWAESRRVRQKSWTFWVLRSFTLRHFDKTNFKRHTAELI